jgi:hypothetical protein
MAAPIVGMAFQMASQFIVNEVLAPEPKQPAPQSSPTYGPFGC